MYNVSLSVFVATYKRSVVVAETVVGATTGVVPAPKGYFKGDISTLFHEVF